MRIEIAGTDITTAMVEAIEDLQSDRELTESLVETLDRLSRRMLLDADAIDDEDPSLLHDLRCLQLIRRTLLVLASPPDAADPSNDIPAASL